MPRDATLRHLAALYADDPDPWGHWHRLYERRKLGRTLRAAGRAPFRLAVEIGCGNGALTARLAPRSRQLLALDGVPEALASASRRTQRPGVTFRLALAPRDLPSVRPDLVILSEVLYFLTPQDIDAVAAWLRAWATRRTRIVAVNWTGSTGEALSGRAAANRLARGLPQWARRRGYGRGYVLDVFSPGRPCRLNAVALRERSEGR